MRILMMCYEFPPIGGGGGRVVEGLCKELANRGNNVFVMTMHYKNLPTYENKKNLHIYRIPCIRLKRFHCTIPEALLYQTMGIPYTFMIARKFNPDLIHSHFIFPDGFLGFCFSSFSDIPFLITAHGSDVPGYNPHRARIAHQISSPIWKKTAEKAKVVVCPSLSIQTLIKRKSSKTLTMVIPNGINPNRFNNVRKKNRILAVTRIVERKGLQYLIRAIVNIDIDWEVNIVGDGPYLPKLKKIAQTMKRDVKFTGWLDNDAPELQELYETSSIFVFPSESENFPICLLEAMASRNAIITTSGTGCEEVVGSSGILIPPKNTEALRTALFKLIDDSELRERMGALAYERLQKKFSWSSIAEHYHQLYQSIVSR